MNNTKEAGTEWSANVIIADADYIDKVAFELSVNFERMIGRRIPKADMAQWLVCVALDGGLRDGDNAVQVILVHNPEKQAMDNFTPSSFTDELNGKAFRDEKLGEFAIQCLPVVDIVSKTQLVNDILGAACINSEVKRIMVIADAEDGVTYEQLRGALQHVDDDSKRITMFAMQPMMGGNFRQEILGYSMLAALGIRADEIKE